MSYLPCYYIAHRVNGCRLHVVDMKFMLWCIMAKLKCFYISISTITIKRLIHNFDEVRKCIYLADTTVASCSLKVSILL